MLCTVLAKWHPLIGENNCSDIMVLSIWSITDFIKEKSTDDTPFFHFQRNEKKKWDVYSSNKKKSSGVQAVLRPYNNASTVAVFSQFFRDTATVARPYSLHGTVQ